MKGRGRAWRLFVLMSSAAIGAPAAAARQEVTQQRLASTRSSSDEVMLEQTVTAQSADLACDINTDGICNAADEALFQVALGSCRQSAKYTATADANGDGCVTEQDESLLFPVHIHIEMR